MSRKRKWSIVFITVAVLISYPFQTPEQRALFVTNDMHPIKGALIRQSWQNYSLEREGQTRQIPFLLLPHLFSAGSAVEHEPHKPLTNLLHRIWRFAVHDFCPPTLGADASFSSGKSAVAIPIELDDNLIYVRVSVNGSRPLSFILDTGAHSIIHAKHARSIGLKIKLIARKTSPWA